MVIVLQVLLLLLWNVVGLWLVVASCGGSWSIRLVWNQCDHIGLEYRAILLMIFCGYLWIFCGYLGIFSGKFLPEHGKGASRF